MAPLACKIRLPATAPLPEPLSFLRIERFLHLLARIAEAIRVLSGIRRAGAKLQLHGVSGAGPCQGPAPANKALSKDTCTNTLFVTDFSQLLLEAAKLCFC